MTSQLLESKDYKPPPYRLHLSTFVSTKARHFLVNSTSRLLRIAWNGKEAGFLNENITTTLLHRSDDAFIRCFNAVLRHSWFGSRLLQQVAQNNGKWRFAPNTSLPKRPDAFPAYPAYKRSFLRLRLGRSRPDQRIVHILEQRRTIMR